MKLHRGWGPSVGQCTNTAQCWLCTAPRDSLLFILLLLIVFWYYTAQSFQLGIYVSFMPVFVGLMHNSKSTSCRRCGENCHLQCVCITNMIQFNLLISQLLNFFHGFTARITQYTFNIQYLATKSRHVIWCGKKIPLTAHLMLIQKRSQGFGFSLWKLGLLW